MPTDANRVSSLAIDLNANPLTQLSDQDLLANTRNLVGRSNQILAALLAHLGEVETRGIHRSRACSSLYTYCIYELRFSEDEAFRRVSASRLVRRFPALFAAIASGELHLTGLLMLGPHLTSENHLEVLARAKHRTKKEIAQLVRLLDPLPDVPARIEPLGPAPTGGVVSTNPTWGTLVHSMCQVRDLAAGERPRDWTEDSDEASASPALASVLPAPARVESTGLVGPQRYKVQFTATEEYVSLVERAQALISSKTKTGSSSQSAEAQHGVATHSTRSEELAELHLRAMRLLVDELEKRKYGAASRPERAARNPPRQRGRHIPAAVRRVVFERDGGRCAFVDALGQRCRETRDLELHHLAPFARGGEHTEANLALRCASHNALAAEEDFGCDLVAREMNSLSHEPFGAQGG